MTPLEDTPRAAFRLNPWRVNAIVLTVLLALSLAAWYVTVDQAIAMRGMVMGLAGIGVHPQGEMGAAIFMAMWMTMMVAMMLPTVAPMVLAHLAVVRRQGRSTRDTVVFVAGYLLVWLAIGVVPLAAYLEFSRWTSGAAESRWLATLAGAILAAAGAYQFTGWKRVCLDHCQSPLAFIAMHHFDGRAAASLRAGIVHGAYCLGCCWALTAVLLVVGLMNLAWMAGIFALFLVEKSWIHGLAMARIAGALLVALGAAVIAYPSALALIA